MNAGQCQARLRRDQMAHKGTIAWVTRPIKPWEIHASHARSGNGADAYGSQQHECCTIIVHRTSMQACSHQVNVKVDWLQINNLAQSLYSRISLREADAAACHAYTIAHDTSFTAARDAASWLSSAAPQYLCCISGSPGLLDRSHCSGDISMRHQLGFQSCCIAERCWQPTASSACKHISSICRQCIRSIIIVSHLCDINSQRPSPFDRPLSSTACDSGKECFAADTSSGML